MPERLNRDPSYDLLRHIITGETGPLSGDPAIRQFDQELDRNDPMDYALMPPASAFETTNPQSAEAIQHMNLTQALGLGMGDGRLGQESIDLNMASKGVPAPSSNYGGLPNSMEGKYSDEQGTGRRRDGAT